MDHPSLLGNFTFIDSIQNSTGLLRQMVTEVIINLVEDSDNLTEVIEALSQCFGEDGNLYESLQELPNTEKVSGYKLA